MNEYIMKRKKAIEYSDMDHDEYAKKQWNDYANMNWNPWTGCFNWQKNTGFCGLGKDCWFYSMCLRLKGRYGYDSEMPWLPTTHIDKFIVPYKRKKPTIYATCFMGDIGYCHSDIMDMIFRIVRYCSQHTFLFLTKMPVLVPQDNWPDNAWLGVTVEGNRDLIRIDLLRTIDIKHRWVSFEPLREKITPVLKDIYGVAIGGKTGSHPFRPRDEWIDRIVKYARQDDCKVVIKENINNYSSYVEWP